MDLFGGGLARSLTYLMDAAGRMNMLPSRCVHTHYKPKKQSGEGWQTAVVVIYSC